MAAAAHTTPPSNDVKSLSNKTVADPGAVDLSRKYPSITKAFALLSREFCLCQMHAAACLTEKVRWAMIASSICGPDVREGCFVRKQEGGWLVRDEAGQVYPLRAKHLLAMLNLGPENRGHIHESIGKLKKQQFFTEHGPHKIWYITVDPAKLTELIQESVRQNATGPRSILSNTSPFFRLAGHSFDLSKITDPEKRLEAEAVLNSLQDEYNSARKLLRDSIRKRAEFVLFGGSILITEKYEELVKADSTERGVSTRHSEPPKEEPPPPPPPPVKIPPVKLPDPLPPLPLPPEPEPQPQTALALVSEGTKRELAWESLRATFEQCGKPISVKRAKDCREEFFKYSLEGQLFIAQDATNRKELVWNEPRWTPDPLKYLQSKIWDEQPIKHRTYRAPPRKTAKEQQIDDAFNQVFSAMKARERNNGHGR